MVQDLLGDEPPHDDIFVLHTWLRARIDELNSPPGVMADPNQAARLIILMTLACSFLHTRRDRINLNILRSLVDLSILREYDWAGAALGTMYREMGDMSRAMLCSLGGTFFIWEVYTNSCNFVVF